MKSALILIFVATIAFSLGYFLRPLVENSSENTVDTEKPDSLKTEEAKKVIGIGGIFFKSKDPKRLQEWYRDQLGFEMNEYGTSFEWYVSPDTTQKTITQWSVFPETETYMEPSVKDFMINYIVTDIEELTAQLRKNQVTILDSIATYEYGKFVHIMDIDGNKIELWEPVYTFAK